MAILGARLAKVIVAKTEHRVILGSRESKNVPNGLYNATSVAIQWDSPESLNRITLGIDVVIHASGMNAQDCGDDPNMALEVNGVVTGEVEFVVYDGNSFFNIKLSKNNYQRLTVKPNLWFAFRGLPTENILLNLTSIEHNLKESENVDLDAFDYN